MDRRLVPFQRWHMAWLQEGDSVPKFDVDTLLALEKQNCWTVVADGDPVACGGTLLQWPGRHQAWMYLNSKTGPHMRFITKAVKAGMDKLQGRIEMTVRADFAQGHRWARILGFRIENEPGILRAFGPEGEDHVSYVKFN